MLDIIRIDKTKGRGHWEVTEFGNKFQLLAKFMEDFDCSKPTATRDLFDIYTGASKYIQNIKVSYCLRKNG